jgi:hypothetical protein
VGFGDGIDAIITAHTQWYLLMPDNTAQFISSAWSGMFADAEATMRQSLASKFWDAKAYFPEGGQAQAHLARLQAAGEAFLLLPQGLFPTMQQGFAMQQKPAFQFHQPAPTAAALLPPPNFPPPPEGGTRQVARDTCRKDLATVGAKDCELGERTSNVQATGTMA